MALNIDSTRVPGSRLELTVTADAAEVDKAFERAFSYLAQNQRIPGFRPGKAPREVLKRQFTAEAIRELAWGQFLEKAYLPALEELEVRPLGEPEFPKLEDAEGFAAGADLEFTATMLVQPEPELPAYRGLQLVQPSAEVIEEDVDKALEDLRKAHARYEKTDRKAVQEGDRVTCAVKVTDADSGEVMEEYSSDFTAAAEGQQELERKLVGAPVGGEVSYDLTLGEDQGDPAVAGKTVTITALVQEITEPLLPEVDGEFAKSVEESLDSPEALREWLRQRLSDQFTHDGEQMVRFLALSVLDARTKIDLPQELLQSVGRDTMQHLVQDLTASGMSGEEAIEALRGAEQGLAAQAFSDNLRGVRLHYLIDALCHQEDLEVAEEDLDRVIVEYAREHGIEERALRQMIEVQHEAEHQFEDRAARAKVVDFLLEHADIEIVPREAWSLRARRLLEEEPPVASAAAAVAEEDLQPEPPAEETPPEEES